MSIFTTSTLSSDNDSSDPVRPGSALGLQRIYRFTVIMLSLLFLTMAVWRPSPSGHVTEVVLRHQQADPTALLRWGILAPTEAIVDGPSRANEWFQNGVRLRELAVGWNQSPNSPLAELTPQQRIAWADQFVGCLSYLVETNNQGGTRIVVRAIDQDPDRGMWALQSLSDQFVADHVATSDATEAVERIGALHREVRVTNDELRVTQERLQEFIGLQLQQRRQEFDARTVQLPEAEEADSHGEGPAMATMNPQWRHLQDSVQRAEQNFQALAQSRTKDHPELAIRQAQIAELEQKLAQTPVYFPNPTTTATPQTTANTPAVSSTPATVATSEFDAAAALQEIESSGEYRELLAARNGAETRVRELQEARDRLPAHESLLQGSVSVQTPTRIIGTLKGRYSPLQFAGLLFFSAAAGVAFAFWPTRVRRPPVIYSVEDAANTLGLPVIGAVSSPGGPATPEPASGHPTPATWTATRMGEIVLVAVLLLMLMATIGDRGFGGQLLHDPFAAYTTAVDRVIHWFI